MEETIPRVRTRKQAQLQRKKADNTILNDVLNVDYVSVRYISDALNSGAKQIIYWSPSVLLRRPYIDRQRCLNELDRSDDAIV